MTTNEVIIISDEIDIEDEVHCSIESAAIAKADYTCPICGCIVADDEAQHICETCGTPHHKDCWEYAGGCAIFGCRKGVIRQETGVDHFSNTITPVNLGLMRMWSWFFRIHWLTFLVTALGLLGATIGGALYMIMAAAATGFSYTVFSILQIVGMLMALPAIAVPLGALAYMLLMPAAIVMRIHFHTINLTLPSGNSSVAKSIADRVDMPDTVRYIRILNTVLAKFAEYLLAGSLVAGLISIVTGVVLGASYNPFFVAAAIFLVVRVIMLPMFKAALESRVTILLTFQNRLIASAKQVKDSHQ